MGNSNSVTEARVEDDPSTNQKETSGEESKTRAEDSKEDGEESTTLSEDSNETKEEGCGICKYIKDGKCKESFIELEKCWDEAEEKEGESEIKNCKEVRLKFKTCMFENLPYYAPFIAAEATIFAKSLDKLQVEKEAILAGDATAIAKALHMDQDSILPVEAAAIAWAFSELLKKKEGAKESNLRT